MALEFLNGGLITVVVAGAFVHAGRASLSVALLAPLALWLPVDVASWWAGRRFGPRAADWLVRRGVGTPTAIARAEHNLDRYGIGAVVLGPWLPLPTALIYAATGWRRLPLVIFIGADTIGTLARSVIFLLVGYQAEVRAVTIARDISSCALALTGVLAMALLGFISIRAMRRQRSCKGLADDAHEGGYQRDSKG